MASSSTSSTHKSFKYDVFLSFRGQDTRTNFVDHLYHGLQQKSIYTYKDDERIKKGKNISGELIGSIQDSKFYIIVFSKNYACSSWCLDELVKIMECHKTTDHRAYPVFYDIEPSDVRNQKGAVAEAFAKYENEEAVGNWRTALKEAADLAGWELKKTADGHESKFIQKIVEELSLELRSISFNTDEKLVGMVSRINDVVSILGTSTDDVRMIGIKGIGGGGKTTLARAVFDQISFQFEGKSFVENVREVSKTSLFGLKSLQTQVLLDVLNDTNISISSVSEGKHIMKRRMGDKKVLVVLDDVDHIDQLEALAGEPSWFMVGSRIIITTRDEQVLVSHGVELKHDVSLLSDTEANVLFNRYAFGRKIPIQDYKKLSKQVVRYASGLPLTIRVLGSFLCGKNQVEWIDALERLKKIPLKETLKKLELSYIALEEDYKEMFLDVACILKGWEKEDAIRALESCGFHARIGLRVLEQKSLITIYITIYDKPYACERVGMHDHIEEMGRNIVRRAHPDKPHKHTRLWIYEEIKNVLDNDLGTNATKCIRLDTQNDIQKTDIKGLKKMKELRFLSLNHCPSVNIVSPEFPDALQYLCVNKYHFRSLPVTFQANNLVSLEMVGSEIEQLWEGGERKVLSKLKILNLSYSMLSLIDLRLTPNVEILDLRSCSKLRTLDIGMNPSLRKLDLGNCCDLEELNMVYECPKLANLDISHSKLRTIDLGLTPILETLHLRQCCCLVQLHLSVELLKLIYVHIEGSSLRTLDLRLAPNLEGLILDYSYDLEYLQMPTRCLNLISLHLTESKLRTLDIGSTPNLKYLDLRNCYHLEEINMAGECQTIINLNISNSKLRTLNLGLTPNLKSLDLNECNNLVQLLLPSGGLKKLVRLSLSCLGFRFFSLRIKDYNCYSVDESLEVGSLAELDLTAVPVKCCPLHLDNSSPKFQFTCVYKEDRPSLTRNLERILSLGMCTCTNLETFCGSICGLQRLRKLKLEGSIVEVLKDLDRLECLEELIISSERIMHLPDSICMLKNLKSLDLKSCLFLEKLPEDLGQLECLEKLDLSDTSIECLPDSICRLKHLEYLQLSDSFVEKLPEELGCIKCLKILDIKGTSISHLPQSILLLKGLCIVGSRELLELCGFTSEIQTMGYNDTIHYVVVG